VVLLFLLRELFHFFYYFSVEDVECGGCQGGPWSVVAGVEVAAVSFNFLSSLCQSFYFFFCWDVKVSILFYFFPYNSSLFLLSF